MNCLALPTNNVFKHFTHLFQVICLMTREWSGTVSFEENAFPTAFTLLG